jgi:branched-chain amino acid aminotransferase
MTRLYESGNGIKLKVPLPKEELSDLVVEACRRNSLKETGYIRLVVTRGSGDLGLSPKKCPIPTIFAIAKSIQMYPPESYTEGLDVIIAETTQKAFRTLSPNVKSGNYLNNVMAYNEILAYNEKNGTNAREAIMLDQDGFIAECTGDNFFMVGFDPTRERHFVYTPGKRACLQGITRDTVRTIVNRLEDEDYLVDGYPIEYHETDIHPKDLKTKARELFLSGTAAEIVPVVRILNAPLGEHEYGMLTIGDGKPGYITKKIMDLFRAETLKPKNSTPIYGKQRDTSKLLRKYTIVSVPDHAKNIPDDEDGEVKSGPEHQI